jgi:hypothetical protein
MENKKIGFLGFLIVLGLAYTGYSMTQMAIAQGQSYYVSPGGDDTKLGTSQSEAWATIGRVNQVDFEPGDAVYFEGGAVFNGRLFFSSEDAGTPAQPITVSSYGTGRATVNGGDGEGLMVYNAPGYNITNLKFVGSGTSTNTKAGVSFYVDLPGDVKLDHVYLDNLEVSGFHKGISIGGWNNNTGYRDIRVTYVDTHDNAQTGINTYAMLPYTHQNAYFGHIRSYNNVGDSKNTTSNTGSGIVMGGVDGGVIERSVAYGNGKYNTAPEGPVGIWTYDSNNVIIQYNESYNNTTSGTADGGGFDLDQNTKNSILQYNYSHGNAGPGYLLAQGPNNPNHTGNIVRYNISENDARKNSVGAISVWGRIQNADIYNNTIFLKSTSSGTPRGVFLHNSSVTGNYMNNIGIRNNIIQVKNGLRLVQALPALLKGSTNIRLENNNYFSTGTTWKVVWGATTYNTLAAWQTATGQEKLNGTPVGSTVNPLLTSPGLGGTIGNADLLKNLNAYKLQMSSPMAESGIDIETLFAKDTGVNDFYENLIPQGTKFSIGAHDR